MDFLLVFIIGAAVGVGCCHLMWRLRLTGMTSSNWSLERYTQARRQSEQAQSLAWQHPITTSYDFGVLTLTTIEPSTEDTASAAPSCGKTTPTRKRKAA